MGDPCDRSEVRVGPVGVVGGLEQVKRDSYFILPHVLEGICKSRGAKSGLELLRESGVRVLRKHAQGRLAFRIEEAIQIARHLGVGLGVLFSRNPPVVEYGVRHMVPVYTIKPGAKMTGRAAYRKGKEGELEWARILRERGIEAHRVPLSGAAAYKQDVASQILGMEVRWEVKRWATIPKWLRDVGDVPVAIRQDHGDWYVILPSRLFFTLLARAGACRPEH